VSFWHHSAIASLGLQLGSTESHHNTQQGVLAQANTIEACRDELASTLEDWLLFRISRQLPVPK
jgi:UPF0150-like